MRGGTAKGGATAKSPKISTSPGTIRKYMTQVGGAKKQTRDKPQATSTDKGKR